MAAAAAAMGAAGLTVATGGGALAGIAPAAIGGGAAAAATNRAGDGGIAQARREMTGEGGERRAAAESAMRAAGGQQIIVHQR